MNKNKKYLVCFHISTKLSAEEIESNVLEFPLEELEDVGHITNFKIKQIKGD